MSDNLDTKTVEAVKEQTLPEKIKTGKLTPEQRILLSNLKSNLVKKRQDLLVKMAKSPKSVYKRRLINLDKKIQILET